MAARKHDAQGNRGGQQDSMESDPVADKGRARPTPSTEEIAARAYAIYESRGGGDGRDQADWFQAEAELRGR